MKSQNQRLGFSLRTWTLLGVAWISLVGMVTAQDPTEIASLYGRGVHAFFAGDLGAAESAFTECINSGSTDPRVYYFRGLVRMRQGGECAGDQDFQLGAMFEARDPGRRYAISNALQRIQGPERIALEQFRRQGRVDKVQERRGQIRARYENLQNREAEVLHQSDPVPLENLSAPSVEVRRAGQPAVATPAPVLEAPTAQPVIDPTPAGVVDPAPVATPPAPAAEPADDDLFGEPAATTPAVEEKASQLDDLFGAEPAAEIPPAVESAPAVEPAVVTPSAEESTESADPFGATTEPAPAPATQPTAEETAADPFGGTEDTTPPVTETTEPAASEDPFGGTTEETPVAEPSAPPATESAPEESTDDPFGETAPATDEGPEVTEEAADAEHAVEESTESSEASEDPFGETEPVDTEAEEAEEASEDAEKEEAVTEDPFGETTDDEATDSGESPESDDTGEEGEAESTEDAPADEAAEEDPFGGF